MYNISLYKLAYPLQPKNKNPNPKKRKKSKVETDDSMTWEGLDLSRPEESGPNPCPSSYPVHDLVPYSPYYAEVPNTHFALPVNFHSIHVLFCFFFFFFSPHPFFSFPSKYSIIFSLLNTFL